MLKRLKVFLFSNRSLGQTILKNAFWLSISQVVSRLIRVAIVIYAARVLGAAGYGVFSYAIAIAGFAGIFSDLGISGLFIREVAKTASLRSKYLSTTFSLKLSLLSILTIIILFVAPSMTHIPEARGLLPLIAFLFLFDGLRDFSFSFIRALERMELEAGLSLLTNSAIVLISLGLLIYAPTPHNLALGYMLGSALGLAAAIYILRSHLRELSLGYSREWVKLIWSSTWPLAISSFFGAILMYTDIIVLGWFRTAPDLGFYSAAQKPIQFLGALPAILAASLLPAMSRLVSLDPKKFKSIMEQSMAVTMGLALPFAVGGLLMGNQLMILLYGPSYNQAIPVFWILVISLLGTFPSAIIQNAILADNLQRKLLPPVIFGAIANLALNLYFTPRLGALGAAISTLIAQLATQGILYYEMQIRFHFQLLFHIRKIILATVVMGLAIIGLKSLGANFWISLSTAVVVYLSLLVLTKETLFEKLKSILAEKTPEPIA